MRLGADPEVFLQDKNGKHISVIGYIQADKWNPHQIPDMPEGFTLQEDNVALEYGIPPASNAEEFVHHIQAVMKRSEGYLKGLSFSRLSCVVFPEDQLRSAMSQVFGCEPDFNAWTNEVNPSPKSPNPNMRSAGGHVHVETQKDPRKVVRNADLFLSVPAVFMDEGVERKQLYGKWGAHRIKPYGVEYRTLSNFWIFEERLIQWVWRNMEIAESFDYDISKYAGRIMKAINNNDKKEAEFLVNEFNLEVI